MGAKLGKELHGAVFKGFEHQLRLVAGLRYHGMVKTMRQSTDKTSKQEEANWRGGLRWQHVYLLFICWTFFSVFLYSHFSTLGDSQSYLTGAYDDDTHAARTIAVTWIAGSVLSVVHVELLAHLVFAFWAATGVGYLAKNARLHDHFRWPLLVILFTPNFGVWASVIGRESIFVGLAGLFLGAVLAYWRKPTLLQALLALVCVAGMTFIRSPYGIGMALFFLMFLLYRSGPRLGLSIGVQMLLLSVVASLVLVFVWPYLDDYITGEVLPKAKGFFSLNSTNTRTWIQIDTTGSLLSSLWWSLPLGLVGPTPAEVWARPVMLPFLVSGLVVFGSFLYSVGVALRAPHGRERKILLLGWLPAVILILIAYVPFGIYNSGSAIRYASCFLLFLIFPSMLLSASSADAYAEESAPEADIPDGLGHSWRSA